MSNNQQKSSPTSALSSSSPRKQPEQLALPAQIAALRERIGKMADASTDNFEPAFTFRIRKD